MSDARALLRAKRAEARVAHPLASYTNTGQLRCIACGTIVRGAAAWEGHVGSKAHRVAVAKLREAQEREERERTEREAREKEERERKGKRKAEVAEEMDVDTDAGTYANAKKRRLSEEVAPLPPPTRANGGFPTDFFSDPSLAPVLSTPDVDDEDEDTKHASAPPLATKSQIDLEWEQFQASLLSQPADAAARAEEERDEDRHAAYERATVFAEAELAPVGAEGFPPAVAGAPPPDEEKEETEEERRRRKEQEERELIMDRMVEEERAQEEADERVGLLKARVEALKKAREAKRVARGVNPKAQS